MLRIFIVLLLLSTFTAQAQHEHAAQSATTPTDTLKKSIPKEVHAQVGEAHVMIHYYAPAVRGRMIWGGLVPYNEVWVTGAHRATTLEFDKDIVIDKTTIAAGKYAVFTIPGEKKWIFIINKKWDQHLADDYDAKDDIVRVEIEVEQMKDKRERLTYAISSDKKGKGILAFRWDMIRFEIPFKVQ